MDSNLKLTKTVTIAHISFYDLIDRISALPVDQLKTLFPFVSNHKKEIETIHIDGSPEDGIYITGKRKESDTEYTKRIERQKQEEIRNEENRKLKKLKQKERERKLYEKLKQKYG